MDAKLVITAINKVREISRIANQKGKLSFAEAQINQLSDLMKDAFKSSDNRTSLQMVSKVFEEAQESDLLLFALNGAYTDLSNVIPEWERKNIEKYVNETKCFTYSLGEDSDNAIESRNAAAFEIEKMSTSMNKNQFDYFVIQLAVSSSSLEKISQLSKSVDILMKSQYESSPEI